MEFEQKAEEKKMSMSKNIARLAVTAGLTAALSFGGVMAPVPLAFADGTTGSITIKKVDDAKKDNTFKAYQIFTAKVIDAQDGSGKIASDVKWAVGDQARKDIITAIRGSKDYSDSKSQLPTEDPITAQDVADWLSANVTTTTASANGAKGTRVAPGDVLYSIAKAVINNETAVGNSIKAGDSWTCSNDGYYLFVSDGLTDTTKPNTGTSPIFAIVGGNPVTVTEKTSIPTVDKQILDDTADKDATNALENDWKNSGDAWIGQDIDYRLTGHVADNIASYDTYFYEFQDTLSKGLKVVKKSDGSPNDLHVYIVDNNGSKKEVKPDADKGYEATVNPVEADGTELLKVTFKNLKTVQTATGEPIEVGAASKVVVTYKAQLTSDAKYTAAGNTNEVKLVYSNDPMSNGTGTSESKKVADYVFGFDVTKIDPANSSAKLDAGFTVKMIKEGSDKSVEKWLKQDGSFSNDVNDAYTFETTETGNKVSIPGLVAGTYLISESKTPAGYNTIADFEITVAPEYNTDGTLKNLNVTSNSSMATPTTDKNVTTTKIPVTIQNKKGSGLPLTGLNGVTFTWIAGGAVLCIGVAHLIRSRKQAEESEQE